MALSGWTLSNISDGTDGQEFTYKFPRGVNLAAGETCAVWSSDSEQVPYLLRPHSLILVVLSLFELLATMIVLSSGRDQTEINLRSACVKLAPLQLHN